MSDKKVNKRTAEDVLSKTAPKRKQTEVQESIGEELSPSEKRQVSIFFFKILNFSKTEKNFCKFLCFLGMA